MDIVAKHAKVGRYFKLDYSRWDVCLCLASSGVFVSLSTVIRNVDVLIEESE